MTFYLYYDRRQMGHIYGIVGNVIQSLDSKRTDFHLYWPVIIVRRGVRHNWFNCLFKICLWNNFFHSIFELIFFFLNNLRHIYFWNLNLFDLGCSIDSILNSTQECNSHSTKYKRALNLRTSSILPRNECDFKKFFCAILSMIFKNLQITVSSFFFPFLSFQIQTILKYLLLCIMLSKSSYRKETCNAFKRFCHFLYITIQYVTIADCRCVCAQYVVAWL